MPTREHLRETLTRVKAIAKKETKQLSRDVRMLAVIFLFPVFLLVMFGYAINFDVTHIQMAVYDLDRSSTSREVVTSLVSSGYFNLVGYLNTDEDIKLCLDENRAQCVLVLPRNLSREVNANRTVAIQYLINGVDANTATNILNYATIATLSYSQKIQNVALARSGARAFIPVQIQPRFWFNPELKSTRFMIPGLIGMILMVVAVVTVALAIVREKERGTIEQINVSPLSTFELMIGKTIPYIVIALINATLILVAGYLFFGVTVKGSFFWLILCTFIYLFDALCLGLLVSIVADSQQVAFQMAQLISVLPSMLLSGFVFPIESMPVPIQLVTYIVPARYFLVCIRSILLKGEGVSVFWVQLVSMIVFAVVVLTIARKRYIKKVVA